MSEWFEVIIPATTATVDDVSAIICERIPAAHSGTEVRSGSVVFWVTPERLEQVLLETRAVVAELAKNGCDVDPAQVRSQPAVPEEEWRDAWKKYFHATRLTRQIVVVPSWERHEYRREHDGDVILNLDPGQAFGTGAHASTQLVLETIQELCDQGASPVSILDVGAGSGILSIAALKMWSTATAVAVDTDPLSVDCTSENSAKNGVAERLRSSDTALRDVVGLFDLVVANIQAHVLRELRTDLVPRVGASGWLILSGLLSTQAEAVAQEYCADAGLEVVAIRGSSTDSEWSSVLLRARSHG